MKKCLIVINTNKKESHSVGKEIEEFLFLNNIKSDFYCFDGFSTDNPFCNYDFVITLGGDGTVLFAARGCVEYGIPIFPINFGEFGFIASIQKSEWKELLLDFINNKISIESRSMIEVEVFKDNKKEYYSLGLNDVVICSKAAAKTIMLDVAYNNASLGEFKADGIVLATPTGSTAYSVSAGGPIIDTQLDALVLTPLNSFSLSTRPLVLSPNGVITIKVLPSRQKEVVVIVDGQKPFKITSGDFINIKLLEKKVKLVGCTTEKFYNALRSKLNWSGGPHA